MRVFPRTTTPVVEFCDRCASVCDARCRAEASREQLTVDLLRRGLRLS